MARATWKVFKNPVHDLKDNCIWVVLTITPSIQKPSSLLTLQFQKNGNGTNGANIAGTTVTHNDIYSALAVYELNPITVSSLPHRLGVNAINNNLNTVVNTATQLIGAQTNLDQAGAIQAEQNRIISKDARFFRSGKVNYKDMLIATVGIQGR